VIYQVNANGVMLIQGAGNLELGADAVNTGDQNRLPKALKFKKSTKEPGTSQDFGVEGSLGVLSN